MRVEEYAYCVNNLPQNIGSETWIWRQILTSQTAHTKYKWPPYATEGNHPHENFLRTPLVTHVDETIARNSLQVYLFSLPYPSPNSFEIQ